MPVAAPPRQRMNIGLSQAHAPSVHVPNAREGGGGGGGGGGSSKSALAGFGPGDEPGFAGTGGAGLLGVLSAMGVFNRQPKLSAATQAKRDALEQQMAQAQKVYGDAMDKGGNPAEAMKAVLQDPTARNLLFTHPELLGKSGDAIHKILGTGGSSQLSVTTLEGKNGKYDVIQTPDGKFHIGTPHMAQDVQEQNATQRAQTGQQNADTAARRADTQSQNTGSLIEHRAAQDQKAAQGGKPGTVSQADRNLFSVAGNAYEALAHLREYANATGPFTGWMKEKGGEYFGASEAGQALANLTDRIDQAAQMGLLDSKYAGVMKQFAATLPSAGKGSDFNTGLINGMLDDMRHRLQSRADAAESQVNRYGTVKGPDGQPLGLDPSTSAELQRADVYTQSQREKASATWKARNTPDALTPGDVNELEDQITRDPATGNFVSSVNPHMDPQTDGIIGRIVQDKAQAAKARQAQPIPSGPPQQAPAPQKPEQHTEAAPTQQPPQQQAMMTPPSNAEGQDQQMAALTQGKAPNAGPSPYAASPLGNPT